MPKITLRRGSPVHRLVVRGSALALAVIVIGLPLSLSPFRVFQFTMVLVLAVLVLGFNLVIGYSGQIEFGHGAFFALGAYITAILIQSHGWPYLAALPVAAAVTFGFGYLFGIPSRRLHGLYLAMATLGLALATPALIKRFDGVTGGYAGLRVTGIKAPAWSGLDSDQWLYYVVLVVTVLMFLGARNLVGSSLGRAIVAVRDDEPAARTMGIDTGAVKTLVFAVSAMYAAVAGALYTYVQAFVAPDSFTLLLMLSLLVATVVGGLATISGAVFGAAFVHFVPFYASSLNEALFGLIYGGALVVLMYLMPGGLVGLVRRVRDIFVVIEDAPPEPYAETPTVPVPDTDPAEVLSVPMEESP